jgi:hypothetical protein
MYASVRHVLLGTTIATLAVSGLSAAHAQSGSTSRPAARMAPSPAPLVAGQVVAYRGPKDALYANQPGSSTFHSLGGRLITAPAVAYAAGSYYFLADLKGHGLEIRTASAAWAPLVKGGFSCTQPDLASSGTKLAVDCLHDKKLYAAKVAVPAHGLPSVSHLSNQGGGPYTIGSGIAFAGKQVWFEIIGKIYEDDDANWNSHGGRLGANNSNQTEGDDFFRCAAKNYEASAPKQSGTLWTGCAIRHKSSDVLSIVAEGEGVCEPDTPGGAIAASRIGIAPTSQTSAAVVYETPAGTIVESTLTAKNNDCNSPAGPVVTLAHGATSGPSIAAGPDGYR